MTRDGLVIDHSALRRTHLGAARRPTMASQHRPAVQLRHGRGCAVAKQDYLRRRYCGSASDPAVSRRR